MSNIIDDTIMKLGDLPKAKRRIILNLINIPIYIQLIVNLADIDFVIVSNAFMLTLTVASLLIDIRIMQLGGWWWANGEDDE